MHLLLPTLARCTQQDAQWPQLLARADQLEHAAAGFSAQLAPCFGWQSAALIPWAALLAHSEGLAEHAPAQARWIALEALSLRVAPNGIYVLASNHFGQEHQQMRALWEAAAPLLQEEGLHLQQGTGHRAFIQLPEAEADPQTQSAEDLLGVEVGDWMPTARVWRRRLNELQILWSQHPVNQQRAAKGQLPINSAWFTAASSYIAKPPVRPGAIYSQDPLLHVLRDWSRAPSLPQPGVAAGTLLDLREDSSAALRMLQSRHPRAQLLFACGARYEIAHWHRWRFWRKGAAGHQA